MKVDIWKTILDYTGLSGSAVGKLGPFREALTPINTNVQLASS